MVFFISKNFGFKILGPFYSIAKTLGLLLVREIDDKVLSSKNGNENNKCRRNVTDVFLPDRRYLAYNALVLLMLCLALRRCVTLVGSWPCGNAESVECSSAIEWIVTAVGTVQAMASVVAATVHRQSRTIGLLNRAYRVLIRRRSVHGHRSHLCVAGAYSITALLIVLTRSVALVASRPDRFSAADVLLVCLPTAVLPIVVECTIVSMCSAAENVFRDVVERLNRLATANAGSGTSRFHRLRLVHWRLEIVWREYWRGCRLVDDLSRCYGLDLAINLIVNMLLFIGYSYITLMSVWASTTTDGQRAETIVYWNVALVCQLVCVSFRIVFISYRAERTTQVATNLVLISLRQLLKNDNLDIKSIITINAFTYQILNREIKVSACGFFSVNLSFFHGLIRLATTYLIVIIQYNSKY